MTVPMIMTKGGPVVLYLDSQNVAIHTISPNRILFNRAIQSYSIDKTMGILQIWL